MKLPSLSSSLKSSIPHMVWPCTAAQVRDATTNLVFVLAILVVINYRLYMCFCQAGTTGSTSTSFSEDTYSSSCCKLIFPQCWWWCCPGCLFGSTGGQYRPVYHLVRNTCPHTCTRWNIHYLINYLLSCSVCMTLSLFRLQSSVVNVLVA